MNRLVFLSSKKQQRNDAQLQFKISPEKIATIIDRFHEIQDGTDRMAYCIQVLQEHQVMNVQALVTMFCGIQCSINWIYAKELSQLILSQLMSFDDCLLHCQRQELSPQRQYNRLLNKDSKILKTMKESITLSGITFQCIIYPEYFQTLLYIINNNEIHDFGQFQEQFYTYLERDLVKGPGMKMMFIQMFNEMALYFSPGSHQQLALAMEKLYYEGFCHNGNQHALQFCLIQLLHCSNISLAENYRIFEHVFMHNIGVSVAYSVQFMRRALALNSDNMPLRRFFEHCWSFQGIQRRDALCLWAFLSETSENITDKSLAQLLICAIDRLHDAHPDEIQHQKAYRVLTHVINCA